MLFQVRKKWNKRFIFYGVYLFLVTKKKWDFYKSADRGIVILPNRLIASYKTSVMICLGRGIYRVHRIDQMKRDSSISTTWEVVKS